MASILGKPEGSFWNNVSLFSNLAIIKSNVVINEANKAIDKDRQLQGQSPYVFNAGALFQNYKTGYSASISLNAIGDRIYIVGNVSEPSLWEKGRTVIDIQFAKSMLKNRLDLRINIKDLLVQNLVFYNDLNDNHKYNKSSDLLIISRNFGNEFSISASYKF